jgi:predicted TIM-barrel fold metal-dependent hydrolase
MKAAVFITLFFLFAVSGLAQNDSQPVIDMHMHCYDNNTYFTAPDMYGVMAPENADEHFKQTYEEMHKNNVVKAVISGSLNSVEEWVSKDKDSRFIRGYVVDAPEDLVDTITFKKLIEEGKIQVLGEIGAIYKGHTLSDPGFEPYLRICEEYGIPVAIHTGGGPPAISYIERYKDYRLKLGDPFLIEDVLVKHPKLRIYMMHAGAVYYEHAVRLMLAYPQLYTDIAVLLWVHPLPMAYAVDFLKRAKQAGMLDRVMYGSDQMVWPYGVSKSIEYLNSMDFLTDNEKQDILYNNAARFLKIGNTD